MEKQILIFSHIPKTAGTTLNYLLRTHFKEDLLNAKTRLNRKQYTLKDFEVDKKFFANLKMISGHPIKPFIDFGNYEKNFKWFTFLREPHNRFISHYIHQQTGVDEYQKANLIDWAYKFRRDNIMVRWIAGEPNLQKAIDILESKFSFVGLVEKFDESLSKMPSQLGINNFDYSYEKPQMVIRDNSLKKEIIDNLSLYRETIEENNALDKGLYNYVQHNIYNKYEKNIGEINSPKNQYIRSLRYFRFKVKDNLVMKPVAKVDSLISSLKGEKF